jgi:chromosome segregation ATPase
MNSQEFVDPDLVSTGNPASSSAPQSGRVSSMTSPSRAELDSRVEQARQQMLQLRHQQEELERQRQDLEDLRRRVEEFEHGKAEVLELLSRTITEIEKEEFETNKRVSALTSFRDVFQDYVNQLHDLRQSEWNADEIKNQLPQALAVLEAARTELNKARSHLEFLAENPVASSAAFTAPAAPVAQNNTYYSAEPAGFLNFKAELLRGFARSIPLLVVLLILAIVLLLTHGR